MATALELKQQREKVFREMKDIREKIGDDGKFVDATQETKWQSADAEFRRLSTAIQEAEEFEKREKEMATAEFLAGENREKPDEKKSLNYDKTWERYIRHGTGNLSEDEKRMLQTRGTDTQITTTDSLGGFIVPTSFSNELEMQMKWYGGVLQACDAFTTSIGGTLEWPTGDDTASTGGIQVPEADTIAVADMTFGQVLFNAYTFHSNVVQVSYQLIQDESVSLTSALGGLLAERIGRNINAKLTTGTGTNQPYGLITVIGSGKEAASQTAFTKNELIDLYHSVDASYRMGPKVGFMMHDLILAAARKLDVGNTDTVQIFTPSIVQGEPDRLLGKPIYINNDMASTQVQSAKIIVFGDFSKYKIRRVAGIQVRRSDERYFENLKAGFLAWTRLDANLVAANSIKYLQNKTT